jgi:hypothetical protein
MSHKLTPKQLKALSMLASGMSTVQIAREIKLRRETISRWRQIPEFTHEYDRLMDEVGFALKSKVTRVMDAAIKKITYEVESSYGDPKRIRALLHVIKTLEK